MGRKPNPVIAQHFIRGEKHGQTTNRYAQTCRHCNLRFPTGRPETLFAHVASCPALSQDERTDAVRQMYNTAPHDNITPGHTLFNQPIDSVSNIHHLDDFDITGLRVLAGAAENAEDLAIDPQIAGHEPAISPTVTEGPPLPFYDNHYSHPYHTTASNNSWPFQFSAIHNPPSPFHDVSSAVAAESTYSTATSPPLTQWSFAPILTTPITYVSHPGHQVPVSFADQHEHDYSSDHNHLDKIAETDSTNSRIRKSREPYSEPKRARVAEMRQVGACIRCSRLRKTCEPARPCKACMHTTCKTWLGGCTTLNKGQEFTIWYDNNLDQLVQTQSLEKLGANPIYSDFDDYLEITYSDGGPRLKLNLVRANLEDYEQPSANENIRNNMGLYATHKEEDIAQKVLSYATVIQDDIIEAIDVQALYVSARVAQGLSLETITKEENLTWGSSKQSDQRLRCIYDLWLVVSLLTTEQFGESMIINSSDGERIDATLESSGSIIRLQMLTAIESVAQQSKDELRRFDANILNQSYKNVFNLVIGMFLILDSVERYCCFMKNHGYFFDNDNSMVEQAQALAYKYAYCVHNIQMMPIPVFDTQSRMLVVASNDGRINHEMQRLWMADLCLSEDDLELSVTETETDNWQTPTGRLWAKLFQKMKP